MKHKRKVTKGQAIVEYIIIIVIVAIATLTVICLFGDRLRTLIGGTLLSISNKSDDKTGVKVLLDEDTKSIIKNINEHGVKTYDGSFNDGTSP